MTDWLGLLFFVLLIAGIFVGLKILSKPQKRTEEEFERGAAESASTLGASMNALHKLVSREAAKPKEVQMQIKQRFGKRKGDGKADGEDEI